MYFFVSSFCHWTCLWELFMLLYQHEHDFFSYCHVVFRCTINPLYRHSLAYRHRVTCSLNKSAMNILEQVFWWPYALISLRFLWHIILRSRTVVPHWRYMLWQNSWLSVWNTLLPATPEDHLQVCSGIMGFFGGSVHQESTCNAGDRLQHRRPGFDPWVWKFLWRKW